MSDKKLVVPLRNNVRILYAHLIPGIAIRYFTNLVKMLRMFSNVLMKPYSLQHDYYCEPKIIFHKSHFLSNLSCHVHISFLGFYWQQQKRYKKKNIFHNNKCSQKAKIYKSGEKRSVGKYNTQFFFQISIQYLLIILTTL